MHSRALCVSLERIGKCGQIFLTHVRDDGRALVHTVMNIYGPQSAEFFG